MMILTLFALVASQSTSFFTVMYSSLAKTSSTINFFLPFSGGLFNSLVKPLMSDSCLSFIMRPTLFSYLLPVLPQWLPCP